MWRFHFENSNDSRCSSDWRSRSNCSSSASSSRLELADWTTLRTVSASPKRTDRRTAGVLVSDGLRMRPQRRSFDENNWMRLDDYS